MVHLISGKIDEHSPGFYNSTSFLFEVAICPAVLGAATFIIDALGHPERDLE